MYVHVQIIYVATQCCQKQIREVMRLSIHVRIICMNSVHAHNTVVHGHAVCYQSQYLCTIAGVCAL